MSSDSAGYLIDFVKQVRYPELLHFPVKKHKLATSYFDALDRGEAMPLTSFEEAFESFRVLFAADQSAAEGRPVKL